MPLAEGLFARAIAQSGAAAHALTPSEGRLVGGYLADALGVTADRDAIAAVPLGTCIKAAADLVTEVQSAPDPARWGQLALSLLPFAPTVDGAVLPRPPLGAIAGGQGGDVPLLIGSNRDEARLFLVASGTLDLIDDAMLSGAASAYGLSADGVATYRARRPGASAGDLLAAVISDWFFRIPALRVAEARASGSPAGTWVYRLDHPEPAANNGFGSCHAVEVPYAFDTIGDPEAKLLLGDAPSQAVADAVHGTWVRFITTGDPGWARYDPGARATGLLTERVTEVSDPDGEERALWAGIR